MAKINVLYISTGMDVGGLEKNILDIAHYIDKKKFNPLFAYLTRGGAIADQLRSEGYTVFALGFPGFNHPKLLFTLLKLVKIIKAHHVQIIHAYNFPPSVIGLFAHIVTGVQFVSSRVQMTGWQGRLHRLMYRIVNKHAGAIIANSQSGLKLTRREGGIEDRRLHHINNPIEVVGEIEPSADELKKQLSIPREYKIVGMVANLKLIKNPILFVKAAISILQTNKEVVFLLIGDGPKRQKLEEMVRREGLDKSILFLGRVTPPVPFYRCMDMFVLTSISEGSPTSILEAMSYGLPIVATSVGGVPEIVRDGLNGFLVPSGNVPQLVDAINKLLRDDNLRKRMGRQSKEIIDIDFNIDKVIEQMERLYYDIL